MGLYVKWYIDICNNVNYHYVIMNDTTKSSEYIKWCEENISGIFTHRHRFMIFFNEEDAMAFKLRFL